MKFPMVFYFQDKLEFSGIQKSNDINDMNVQSPVPVPDFFYKEDNYEKYSDTQSYHSIKGNNITSVLV